MATAIIVVLLVVFCFFAAKRYLKIVGCGCCGTGGDDEKASEQNCDPAEYKYKYTVTIGGMSCKNCAARIENAFNRKDGIHARADFKNGTAEVYSNEIVTEFTIRQAVIGLGYSVENIEQNEL